MSARIDIVNIALTWIGADQITSLEDESPSAVLMLANYYLARDATLEEAEWSFAIKRWIPARSAEIPIGGAAYFYPIPSDILTVLRVDNANTPLVPSYRDRNNIDTRPQVDWRSESGNIVTNEEAIVCKGIRRIEDEGIYSPLFCHSFAAHLAMLCAFPITESVKKFEAMSALYAFKIKQAKARDGQQGTSKRIRNRTTTGVR